MISEVSGEEGEGRRPVQVNIARQSTPFQLAGARGKYCARANQRGDLSARNLSKTNCRKKGVGPETRGLAIGGRPSKTGDFGISKQNYIGLHTVMKCPTPRKNERIMPSRGYDQRPCAWLQTKHKVTVQGKGAPLFACGKTKARKKLSRKEEDGGATSGGGAHTPLRWLSSAGEEDGDFVSALLKEMARRRNFGGAGAKRPPIRRKAIKIL